MTDTILSPSSEEVLREGFGKRFLLEMADELDRCDAELMYRARQMGLRSYCEYLPLERIVAWLNLGEKELKSWGVPVMVCKDEFNIPLVRLVSFASLVDIWQDDSIRDDFFAQANMFLCQEIKDLIQDMQTFSARWEDSFWTSHEHTHLNPRSKKFGEFYLELDDSDSQLLAAEF